MSIESIRIYHFPATRSARVLWAAHEVNGCGIEVERVDLYAGAQHAADYLARNPNHSVPKMEITWDDGSVQTMIESVAMVAFLADAFPSAKIAPAPGASPARADYLRMLHFCGTQMDMMLWQIRVHEHLLEADQRDERTAERYRAKFKSEAEPQLAARLARQPFVCGDEFTAADCVAGHNVTWARGYGLCQDDAFKQYLSRLSKRPAFIKAFADARTFRLAPSERSDSSTRFNG